MTPTPPLLMFTNNHNTLIEMGKSLEDRLAVAGIAADPDEVVRCLSEALPDIVVLCLEDLSGWDTIIADLSKRSSLAVVKGNSDIDEEALYQADVDVVFDTTIAAASLAAWVNRRLGFINSRKQLQLDAQSAAQTANIAMTNSSELGRVIHFVESTFDLHSTFALANGIFQLLQTIGLSSSIDFRWANGDEDTFNSDGCAVGDADKLILQEFCNDGRIIDFAAKTLVNYPKVSLLVKDMPIEDEESYGRIKDLLPIILGAVNEKMELLDQEKTMYINSCETVQVFYQFHTSTFELAKAQNDNTTQDIQWLTAITQSIFESLPGLGLDEKQKNFIDTSLQKALDKTAVSFQESAKNTADLLMMLEDIKELSTRLETIAESFAPRAEELEPEIESESIQDDTEYDFEDDDIILF